MPERPLSWQPGFTLWRKPTKRPAPRRNQHHQFEIVVEHPQHRSYRHARHSPSTQLPTPPHLRPPFSSDSSSEHTAIEGPRRPYLQSEAIEGNEGNEAHAAGPSPVISDEELATSPEASSDLETIDSPAEPQPSRSRTDDDHSTTSPFSPEPITDECNVNDPDPNAAVLTAATTTAFSPSLMSESTIIPPTIEFGSLMERFRPVLTRYNTEFCTIPLTFQLRINPFRYRTDLDPEPSFLVHAVMALAGHHVNSASTMSHRHEALQLLRQSLRTFSDAETMYSVLDTIVILFSLDETQSILGNWSVHLMGAYDLLEAYGGIQKIALSSRVEAQIGILTWWDAITSLLSREECVFSYEYFDAVLSNQHKREWDFFGLCGCPTSIVTIVMWLARLSAERRKASLLAPHAEFDDTVISEIEHSLESWFHIPAATALLDEDGMHQNLDAMHCSEAWRNGLLLYVFRVFRWEPGSSVPAHVLYRARAVVDHVVSCRDVNMVARQALLPLFFAGCELQDRSTRAQIVKLCSMWDKRTRYHMFGGAISLLEEVWANQETEGWKNVWWGQVVDRHHTSAVHPLKVRLCFG